MYEIMGDRITLPFALKTDMRRIYEMMISDEVGDFMFNEDHPAPSWEKFLVSEKDYFPEMASSNGSYMLIYYESRLAGVVKYVCGFDKMPYSELAMWLAGYEFMGKKIGCEAVNLLKDYIHKSYGINEFIIRPWTMNLTAIQAYNRCGFHESASFNLKNYYSEDEMKAKGDGWYGPNQTLNLYCNMMEESLI